ncbi:MAG: hypothetical protein AAGF90_13545, partial [Pseudomonadota bacterium]
QTFLVGYFVAVPLRCGSAPRLSIHMKNMIFQTSIIARRVRTGRRDVESSVEVTPPAGLS